MTPHIRNWTLVNQSGDREFNLETGVGCIVSGNIYRHSRFQDGEYIFTSRIVATDGFNITTQSGSKYTLAGPPAPPLTYARGEKPNLADKFPAAHTLYQRENYDKETH